MLLRLILHVPSRPYFFYNPPATSEIYTLSLHDALPICGGGLITSVRSTGRPFRGLQISRTCHTSCVVDNRRSEEHTSELQSRGHLVCRLLLEKKKEMCDLKVGGSRENTLGRTRHRTECA